VLGAIEAGDAAAAAAAMRGHLDSVERELVDHLGRARVGRGMIAPDEVVEWSDQSLARLR
jgi:hypothetical protein